jgi:hypothetical protein
MGCDQDRSVRAARGSNGRRALQVLADAPDGCTEAIMLAHGFKLDLLVDLVRDGFAIARTSACAPVDE